MTDIMTDPALLIIDVQTGLDDPKYGERSTPTAEANMTALLAAWREHRLPVIHVKHNSVEPTSPLRPELPGNAFKAEVQPIADEPIFEKSVNSAFIGTDLDAYLREHSIGRLVVVGLTTDHCVSTSVRMAANLGFEVTLVGDATATHERTFAGRHFSADDMHTINLASLDGEFCTVRSTLDVLATIAA